jgi:DNA-binding NtrC family response regulator
MGFRKPKVLLIGETINDSSYLAKRLEERGCHCSFAKSYQESASLLRQGDFDLVLSPARLRDCSGSSLIDQLNGSGATLFYYHAVERGCWWLPALQRGRECFGSPALRPSEFVTVLDELIKELRSEEPVSGKGLPLLVPESRASLAAMPSMSPSLAELRNRLREGAKDSADRYVDSSYVNEDSGILHSRVSLSGHNPRDVPIRVHNDMPTINRERKVTHREGRDSYTTISDAAPLNSQ